MLSLRFQGLRADLVCPVPLFQRRWVAVAEVHLFGYGGHFIALEPDAPTPDFMALAASSPLVRRLEARTRASEYALGAARSAFSPELSLSSSIGRSAVDDWNPDESEWRAGLDLVVPIYEGGSGRAGVARARAVVSREEADLKSGLHGMLDLLEERWKLYMDARQYVAVRKKFLEAAVERAAIANAQYSNGLISFDDWVIIEDSLVSAKKGVSQCWGESACRRGSMDTVKRRRA